MYIILYIARCTSHCMTPLYYPFKLQNWFTLLRKYLLHSTLWTLLQNTNIIHIIYSVMIYFSRQRFPIIKVEYLIRVQ